MALMTLPPAKPVKRVTFSSKNIYSMVGIQRPGIQRPVGIQGPQRPTRRSVFYKQRTLDLEAFKLPFLLSKIVAVSALPVPKSRLTTKFHGKLVKIFKKLAGIQRPVWIQGPRMPTRRVFSKSRPCCITWICEDNTHNAGLSTIAVFHVLIFKILYCS